MVVVAGTFLIALQPIARGLIEVFADIGLATHVLALHILLHLCKEETVAHHRRRIVVNVVGHRCQRLRSGKGPYGTVPLAFAHTMGTELRVTALSGGLSVRRRETFRVGSLQPCNTISGIILGQMGVPRHEADGLSDVGAGVDTMGLEELMLLIPQPGMHLLAKVGGLVEIGLGLAFITCQPGCVADSLGIAIHIAVDTGAQILLLATAADGLLHGVLHVGLPVEPSFTGVGGLPVVVLPLQRGQHGDDPFLAPIHQIALPQGVGYPGRVVAELLHRFTVVALVPGVHCLVQINRVVQPSALMDMVAYTRGNEVILVGIAPIDQKLGHRIADGCLLDMLP